MFAGGGPQWIEFDVGAILTPLGLLLINNDKNGLDILKGILFLTSALTTPNFHIPLGEVLDFGLSAHLLRSRLRGLEEFELVGGLGVAANSKFGKGFTISLMSEASLPYTKKTKFDIRGGLRIGWCFK